MNMGSMPETLPMISASELLALRGCECVADVELPDGTLPVNGAWRMERQQWNLYRAECASIRASTARVIEQEGCAS